MRDFKVLNNTEMNKIVGGLLIEHVDFHPDQFTPSSTEANKEEEL